MRRYIERSSDAGPSSLRLFCLGCIIATRGYDFREGQVQDEKRMEPELDAIARELEKLENKICRGC